MLHLLKNLKSSNVLIVGDIGLDQYTFGSVDRISPEAPVPVLVHEREEYRLGLAANVANNVRSLGGVPMLIGVVGYDKQGTVLQELLNSNEIGCDLFRTSERPTTTKHRFLTERQQLIRVDTEDVSPMSNHLHSHVIMQKITPHLEACDIIILQDYAKGLLEHRLVRAIIEEANKQGKPVFVDPNKKTNPDFYADATLIKPNRKEAEALTNICIEDLPLGAEVISQKYNIPNICITLGKGGMFIRDHNGHNNAIQPVTQEVYDVSGAGDTAIAMLAIGWASGLTLHEAAFLANIASGLAVKKVGTATVTKFEIESFLKN